MCWTLFSGIQWTITLPSWCCILVGRRETKYISEYIHHVLNGEKMLQRKIKQKTGWGGQVSLRKRHVSKDMREVGEGAPILVIMVTQPLLCGPWCPAGARASQAGVIPTGLWGSGDSRLEGGKGRPSDSSGDTSDTSPSGEDVTDSDRVISGH